MNFLDLISLTTQHIKQILLVLFFIVTSIQIFYYLFFYIRVFWFKKQKQSASEFNPPVSIIIAAHNESENLKEFLPFVLKQDYPKFEVIVINDRSNDDTDIIIAEFQKKHKHLKTTFINNNGRLKHGKKLAITLGIKAASYNHILLTDADCKPYSNQWIKESIKHFLFSDIVLGYGPYFEENTFLNRIIRYDTMFIALQYLSFAKAGLPYMGIGRNLAYKKELFVKNRGLASHAHLQSGDDDLFINEVANSKNVSISIDKNSFVYSTPQNSLKDWIWQKKRHLTTFHRYKAIHKIFLSIEVYSRVLFYILLFSLINLNNYYFIALAFLRLLIFIIILSYSAKFFKEKRITPFIIIFDLLLPLFNFFVYLVYPKLKNK